MGTAADYRVAITADASQAKAAVLDFDKTLQKLGSSNSLGNILSSANKEWGSFNALTGKAKDVLGSIPIPAAAVVGAIAGIGAAAYGAGQELFTLAKQGSDFGRSFAGFENKTGLSAKAVSTLAYAAKTSGKELSDLQKPIVKLNEMLYKAQGGSEEARASLAKMGVTSLDLETAIDQLAKGANNATDKQQRLHDITTLLSVKSGPDFLSILSKMPEGFIAAQKEAEKLGLTLTEDDVRAAKEFGKAYDTVAYQIQVATAKFALQYAPAITDAIKDVSKWISSNKDTWTAWGWTVAKAISGTITTLREMWKEISDNAGTIRTILAIATMGGSELALGAAKQIIDNVISIGDKKLAGKSRDAGGGGKGDISPEEDLEDQKKERERAAHEREQIAQRDAAARVEILTKQYDAATKGYDHTLESLRNKFKETGNLDDFKTGIVKAAQTVNSSVASIFASLTAAENERDKIDKKTSTEMEATRQKQENRAQEFIDHRQKQIEENNKIILASSEKANRESYERDIAVFEANQKKKLAQTLLFASEINASEADQARRSEQIEAETLQGRLARMRKYQATLLAGSDDYKRITQEIQLLEIGLDTDRSSHARNESERQKTALKEIQKFHAEQRAYWDDALKALEDIAQAQKDQEAADKAADAAKKAQRDEIQKAKDAQTFGGILQASGGIKLAADPTDPTKTLSLMKSAFIELKTIGVDALKSLASGLGSIVEQWVLMGSSAPHALRKMVASVLAAVAAQCAVLALMELAMAFAAMSPWGAAIHGSPASHFKAAALFGAAAAAAGLAGRVVAGSAFQAQTANGGAGATSSGGGRTGNATSGQAFSGQTEQTIDQGRNTTGGIRPLTIKVDLGLSSNGVLQLLKSNVESNGLMRGLIIKTVRAV